MVSEVYDEFKEKYLLNILSFNTINEFLAYGNSSGYSIKRKTAYSICEDNTWWERLHHFQTNVWKDSSFSNECIHGTLSIFGGLPSL